VLVCAVAAVVVAGCHKNVPPQQPSAPSSAGTNGAGPVRVNTAGPAPAPAAPAPAPAPRALSDEEVFARKSLEQLNEEHPLSDVFFDLDQATIRDDSKTSLQRDVEWLNKWKSTQVAVEGHCDSRGSSEYNLALGSRRAEAVKAYLMNLGLPASRITVVSKGKEQPFCGDENDACWQQNRRGHFVITAK
jgi:peptidoglycan-associated lipoprotein